MKFLTFVWLAMKCSRYSNINHIWFNILFPRILQKASTGGAVWYKKDKVLKNWPSKVVKYDQGKNLQVKFSRSHNFKFFKDCIFKDSFLIRLSHSWSHCKLVRKSFCLNFYVLLRPANSQCNLWSLVSYHMQGFKGSIFYFIFKTSVRHWKRF